MSDFGSVARIIGWNVPDDETIPNARLITASPDLLAALEEAFVAMGRAGANANLKHPQRKAWEKAREAIELAEGGA